MRWLYKPENIFCSSLGVENLEMKMGFSEDERVSEPFVEIHLGKHKSKYAKIGISNRVMMNKQALNILMKLLLEALCKEAAA